MLDSRYELGRWDAFSCRLMTWNTVEQTPKCKWAEESRRRRRPRGKRPGHVPISDRKENQSTHTHTHTHTRTQNVSKKSPISALPSCFYRVFTRASGVLRLAFPFLVGATIRYGLTVLPLPFFFIFLVEYRCKIRFATAFRAIFPPIPSLSCS